MLIIWLLLRSKDKVVIRALTYLKMANEERELSVSAQCKLGGWDSLSSNAYEFDKREMRFHLSKSVVTFPEKNYKG